jgi:hypothetical protein
MGKKKIVNPTDGFKPCFVQKEQYYKDNPGLAPKRANKDTKETKTASKKPTGKKK